MSNCGTSLGHEDCGMIFIEIERDGHKASRDAWTRSKNQVYKRKIKGQEKMGSKR